MLKADTPADIVKRLETAAIAAQLPTKRCRRSSAAQGSR